MLIKRDNKTLIGLTGNIASGKSTVMRMWDDRLFLTIDSDRIARYYLLMDPEIKDKLIKHTGVKILKSDGGIDISALSVEAFKSRELMKLLEDTIHPRVIDYIQEAIDNAKTPFVLIESALIFEKDMKDEFDKVITVFADEETRVRRLIRRTGISKEEAIKRVKFQMSEYLKILRSDYVIDNSGDKRWLSCQVENIKQDILKEYKQVKNG